MSVERETVRTIASVLRGAITLPDAPTYVLVANACRKELQARGLLIQQDPHWQTWENGKIADTVHPTECAKDWSQCEILIRAVDYEESEDKPADGTYRVEWDEEEPYNLEFIVEEGFVEADVIEVRL